MEHVNASARWLMNFKNDTALREIYVLQLLQKINFSTLDTLSS
jgi:hypothetical protein